MIDSEPASAHHLRATIHLKGIFSLSPHTRNLTSRGLIFFFLRLPFVPLHSMPTVLYFLSVLHIECWSCLWAFLTIYKVKPFAILIILNSFCMVPFCSFFWIVLVTFLSHFQNPKTIPPSLLTYRLNYHWFYSADLPFWYALLKFRLIFWYHGFIHKFYQSFLIVLLLIIFLLEWTVNFYFLCCDFNF